MHIILIAVTTLFASLAAAAPAGPAGYQAEIQKWRAEREARLKADGGWLTVAGLYWLKDGANRFGTAKGNEVVLPEGSAPALAGVFELGGGKTTVRVEPGVSVTAKGAPVTTAELRPDTSGEPDVLSLGRLTLHVISRGGRYGIRLKDADNPRRREFKGLRWFPASEASRITARFVPFDPPRTIEIPNVLGQIEQMTCPGQAIFKIGGTEMTLEPVLESPDAKELFFIFRDATAGRETYPGGRFLYAERPKGATLVLDFNKAYSPPCAFTSYATCPLPPKQNRLPVRIEAGEMYEGPQH
jgi:hypothetical protein